MADTIPSSEITPRSVYLNRRSFMRAGVLTAAAAGTGLLYRKLNAVEMSTAQMPGLQGLIPDADERGPGAKRVTLAGARVFVLPNPSGRNRAFPGAAAKLVWYRALAEAFPRART